MRLAIRLPYLPVLLCMFAAAVVPTHLTRGQAPGNNTCGVNQAAFTIPGTGGSVTGTLMQASSDGSACGGAASADVYYYFVPAAAGLHRFSTCGSPNNTVLSVHTGCPANGLTMLACNDDAPGCSGASQFDFAVTAGTLYVVRVGSHPGSGGSPFTLAVNPNPTLACCFASGSCTTGLSLDCPDQGGAVQSAGVACAPNPCPQPPGACCTAGVCAFISSTGCAGVFQGSGVLCSPTPCIGACCVPGACTPMTTDHASCAGTWTNCTQNCGCGTPPANDLCTSAITITVNQPVSGDNCAATSDWDGCFGTLPPHTMWYRFIPTTTGYYMIDFCGSAVNPIVSVFAGSCGSLWYCGLGDTAPDAGCADRTAAIPDGALTAGTPYFLGVTSWGPDGSTGGPGPFTLTMRAIATGACCHVPSSTCTITSSAACGFGATHPAEFQFLGAFSACSPINPCLSSGACCTSSSQCELTYQTLCSSTGRSFAGAGSACQPTSACGALGACCAGNGTCRLRFSDQCVNGDVFMGIGTTCAAVDCPPAGACCISHLSGSGSCVSQTEVGCNSIATGVWFGPSSVCTTIDCAAMGACCFADGSCLRGAPSLCRNAAGLGAFQGFVPCQPSPCAGACCTGASCSITASTGCGGTFMGPSTACLAPDNPITCCPANFNQAGGLTVQDIFDFLAAYFLASTTADFNQSGSLSVQDIFDFLAAYFAGCS